MHLASRYRPQSLSQVVGQVHIVKALTQSLIRGSLHPALLLSGTRGVGKTTLARILSKCMNCESGITPTPCNTCQTCLDIQMGRSSDVFEIDAASRNKVEETRALLDGVRHTPLHLRKKIYIIDELHMFSDSSFATLLKVIEEPPDFVQFIFATTEIDQIMDTVLSRCLHLHLKPLDESLIQQHLKIVLDQEHQTYDPEALHMIAKRAQGSMRDALTALDQVLMLGQPINMDSVVCMLGLVPHEQMIKLLLYAREGRASELWEQVEQCARNGIDFDALIQSATCWMHQIAIEASMQKKQTHQSQINLNNQKPWSAEEIQQTLEILLLHSRYRYPTPRIGLEMTLLRLMMFRPSWQTPVLQAPIVTPHLEPVHSRNTHPPSSSHPSESSALKTSSVYESAWKEWIDSLKEVGSLVKHALKNSMMLDQSDHQCIIGMEANILHALPQATQTYLEKLIYQQFKKQAQWKEMPSHIKTLAQLDEDQKKRIIQDIQTDPVVQSILHAFPESNIQIEEPSTES